MAAIVGNPKSVRIPEVDAAQLSRVLDGVALARIGFTDLSIPRGTIEVHDNGPPDEGAGLPPPWGR